MKSRFRAVLGSTVMYLAMAAVIAGLGFFMVQLFNQGEVLREISPDPGMTKHCKRDSDGAVVCTQAPTVPTAPAATPDPDAPLYVTVGP